MTELSDWQVLLVEDEDDSQYLIQELLDHHGISVVLATDGDSALEILAENEDITLVLMDLSLPGRNGWETLDVIRNTPATRDLPVVALTAYGSASVAADARAAGFTAYFAKPINPMEFVDRLKEMV